MELRTESYAEQVKRWPQRGRVILAQFDDDSVVVYQAFRPEIAAWAVDHQAFGGPAFSFTRMSWIKPNFLWMMFRAGWGTKEHQEAILAIRLRREAFLAILSQAVHSTYTASLYGSPAAWKEALKRSHVRLQWDPDHGPTGAPLERRAVQLGLNGPVLERYATRDILSIEDITPFVREQHTLVQAGRLDEVRTPQEAPFPVEDATLRSHLGLTG